MAGETQLVTTKILWHDYGLMQRETKFKDLGVQAQKAAHRGNDFRNSSAWIRINNFIDHILDGVLGTNKVKCKELVTKTATTTKESDIIRHCADLQELFGEHPVEIKFVNGDSPLGACQGEVAITTPCFLQLNFGHERIAISQTLNADPKDIISKVSSEIKKRKNELEQAHREKLRHQLRESSKKQHKATVTSHQAGKTTIQAIRNAQEPGILSGWSASMKQPNTPVKDFGYSVAQIRSLQTHKVMSEPVSRALLIPKRSTVAAFCPRLTKEMVEAIDKDQELLGAIKKNLEAGLKVIGVVIDGQTLKVSESTESLPWLKAHDKKQYLTFSTEVLDLMHQLGFDAAATQLKDVLTQQLESTKSEREPRLARTLNMPLLYRQVSKKDLVRT